MNAPQPFTLDTTSGLATDTVSSTPAEFEAKLRAEGFSCGLDTQALPAAMSHYLSGEVALAPFSKYGDLSELLAALSLTLPTGEKAHTILTPRSAAGPNLRLLVQGVPRLSQGLDTFTWRVFELPPCVESRLLPLGDPAAWLQALRGQIQAKCRPTLLRLYNARQVKAALGPQDSALALLRFEGEARDVALRLERYLRTAQAPALSTIPALLTTRDFAPLQLAPTALTAGLIASWKTLDTLYPALDELGGGVLHLTLGATWHHAAYLSVGVPATAGASLEATLGAFKALLGKTDARIVDWPSDGFGEMPKPVAYDWPTL